LILALLGNLVLHPFYAIKPAVKVVFSLGLAALILLSLLAWKISPQADTSGKIPLIWCSDDNPLRREQVQPFNKMYPQYDLRLDPANAGMEKVLVQSLGGVGPDLFDCYSAFELAAYVRAGIAWDVTDELKKRGIDVQSTTWKAVHPDCIFQGRVYGHPVNAATMGIWFHKDILQDAGVTLPTNAWTWDDLIVPARKLTRRDNDGRIIHFGLLMDWEIATCTQFIMQWGGSLYSPDGKTCTLDSPDAIAAIQFMHDLIYVHKVCAGPLDEASVAAAGGWGAGKGTSITLFGARKGALAVGGRYWLCRLRDPEFKDLKLGAAQCPCGKIPVFLGFGKATLINKDSPHRQDALDFLTYLHSEPFNELINHEADGVGPLITSVQGNQFLHDPAYPQEDYNAVWREMMEKSVPFPTSPFINGAVAYRFFRKELDMVRADDKSAADAMHDAAKEINAQIQENLKLNPELRKKYEGTTSRDTGFQPELSTSHGLEARVTNRPAPAFGHTTP